MLAYILDPQLIEHDFLKRLPRDELDAVFAGFPFHTKPRLHQLVCLLLVTDYSGFGLFVDMGGGKTKIILDMVRYRKRRDALQKTLVVVPYPANTVVWHDEAKIHAPDLKIVSLTGTMGERFAALDQTADVFVINYMGLFVLMCDLVRELTPREQLENRYRKARGLTKRQLHKTGRRINKEKASAFAELWDCVVFDESHFIGHHDTDQFKLCAGLSKAARFSYVLTGTPFGRDPAILWPQYFCADLGLTFGDRFTQFRSVFYDVSTNLFGKQYKFNKAHKDDLRRMMRNRAIVFRDTEFSDLPPVSRQTIRVEMTPQMQPYYERHKIELLDLTKRRLVRLIKNKFHQLRAITSGYVIGDVDENGETMRVRADFDSNPKIEAIRTLCEGLPENRKITIYHEYIYSGDLLVKMAKSLNIKHARLGHAHDGAKELRKFLDQPDCRILVAQSRAGGVGTNLQKVCNYCCYMECPTSPITRKQSEKRFPRQGQDKRVFIYDIEMSGTVDRDIHHSLDEGLDFVETLLHDGVAAVAGQGDGRRSC